MYINNLGHMIKMAAMPIHGKNLSKVFFFETNGQISLKLGVKHLWLKYYNVYINHDPLMTLSQFIARSIPMHLNGENLKGKASRKLANGQNIDYSEKKK